MNLKGQLAPRQVRGGRVHGIQLTQFWRAVQGYILDHFQVKVHVPCRFDDSYENFRLAFHFATNHKLRRSKEILGVVNLRCTKTLSEHHRPSPFLNDGFFCRCQKVLVVHRHFCEAIKANSSYLQRIQNNFTNNGMTSSCLEGNLQFDF